MLAIGFTFEHSAISAIAWIVLIGIVAIVVKRRPAVPRATMVLIGIGITLLALAASGVQLQWSVKKPVAVMVDLSPSTRGAAYRDPAALKARIRELLGDVAYEIKHFADESSRQTILPANDAPAIVLFSDGRLTWPDALPPTYCVIDPALENVADAAVTSLDARGDSVAVGVRNTTSDVRALNVLDSTERVERGAYLLTKPLAPTVTTIAATFAPGDLWPENDALRTSRPPATTTERWWIGTGSAPAGWRAISPQQLPNDPAAFLAASVVVLDNLPADSLDESQQTALSQYARDLGGGILILGGDHAFAAGHYAGTRLEELSPLASTPPEPTTHWMLLADASGSMNQGTRWQSASNAIVALSKELPPADLVSIGSFADELQWWSSNQSATETAKLRLPPDNFQPRGRTNLDATLRAIVATGDVSMPRELLVATDAQASIEQPAELGAQLKAKKIRVHVLLIDDAENGSGKEALQTIVTATNGTMLAERLPENWLAGLRRLFRAAQPSHVETSPLSVRFVGEMSAIPPIETPMWNRTWPKANVVPLAEARIADSALVPVARWNFGVGRVAAVAFSGRAPVSELTRLVERQPRDPRFKVSWITGSSTSVSIDAAENGVFLNGERFTLDVDGVKTVPQTAPGRYELTIPATGGFARLRRGEQLLDVISIPKRYPPEFDAAGNDRAALARLAHITGGSVIEPADVRPLPVNWPREAVSLVSWLAVAGAAMIAVGLIRWRVGS